MKRMLVALAAAVAMVSSANAADLGAKPVYKAPPAVMLAYNWSGFYIGGHAGYGWQNADSTLVVQPAPAFPPGTVVSTRSNGFLGGAQVGGNWQTGNWVFGLEGDFSWTNASGSVSSASPFIPTLVSTGTVDFNWFATGTGRVGYAWNNWLGYVKGGAAWANFDIGGSATIGGVLVNTVNTFTDTRMGWTVGVGLEHGFAGNWSWKLEYNYMDFGTETYNITTTPPAAGITTINHDLVVHVVKAGINYRFGPL